MTYSIIIPCYNEEDNVVDLVHTLEQYEKQNYNIEYILVENGSSDNTRELLNNICKGKSQFKISYVDINRGYGYGLLQGLKLATGDYVGWLHADLQVAPKEMLRCIEFVETHQDGNKYFLKGRRKNRKLIDNFFTFMMTIFETILFKCYLYDIGAIPVLFSRELIKDLRMFPYDFSIELYIYYCARKAGYVVRRFPVYTDIRKKGTSSWNKGLKARIGWSIRMIRDSVWIKKHQ